MKALLLIAALITSNTAYAQTRSFDFLGFNTSTPVAAETRVAGRKCKVAQVGLGECWIVGSVPVGTARLISLKVRFNNARMIYVKGSTISAYHSSLSEALEAKYGAPSKTETRKWQNRAGAAFDNVVQVWLFSDGALELRSMGDTTRECELVFVSNQNLPDRQAPPINF
jgi:hypothetical protein